VTNGEQQQPTKPARVGASYRGAADHTPGHFRRLHPFTPLLKGWAIFGVIGAIALQNLFSGGEQRSLVFLAPAALVLGFAGAFLSWWFTRYGFDGEDLRIDSGVFQRRSRRVRMDRLQAVDVVRPFVGRVLGVSELRLEVAGGAESEAPLAYLAMDDAIRLRAELLARSAGIAADTPEAPERPVHEVPLGRLVGSTLLSGVFVFGVIFIGAFFAFSGFLGSRLADDDVEVGFSDLGPGALGVLLPGLIAIGLGLWQQLGKNFGFALAESPDGFRIRKGLLDTRAQTVPPGRIQGVAIKQPLLWRITGWVRLDVDVAGYAGSSQAAQTSTLIPVATYPEALDVLRQVLPGADPATVPLSRAPRRSAWLRPIGWYRLAYGADDRIIVAREGVFHRTLTIVPHAKTQSVRLTQGPLQRRLELATVWVDTTPGPVDAIIRHRPPDDARQLVDAQAERARLARRVDVPEQWMAASTTRVEVSDGDGDPAASIGTIGSDSAAHHDEEQDPPGDGDSG
jgi:putative membrane protein